MRLALLAGRLTAFFKTHFFLTLMDNTERSVGYGRFIGALFNLLDLGVVNALFGITILLYPQISENTRFLRELWVLINVSFIPVLVWSVRNRHNMRAIQLDRVFTTSVGSVVAHALVFMSLIEFLRIPVIPKDAYLAFYGMLLVGLTLTRITACYILKEYRRKGHNYTRALIIGTGSTAERLAEHMQTDSGFGYRILGFVANDKPKSFSGKYLGDMDILEDFVKKNRVDQIYYTLSGEHASLGRVIKIADDNVVEFYYVPQISRYLSRRFELNTIGHMPVLSTLRNPLKSTVNSAVKRTFDIVVSSVFLLFYPLVYIPVAIGIKITSPGPVYFRQERTGYMGKSFKCLKFRTMKVNADSDRQQATASDPRKTRFGSFLRKTSIDELPQFINVLRGDMSIVGPRPHMLKHTKDYTKLVDKYMVRHAVKPGITGWAQVNGYRGITDELWKMEKRVECDVWYIEHWSFPLDLKIMVRTVLNAIRGESNAF